MLLLLLLLLLSLLGGLSTVQDHCRLQFPFIALMAESPVSACSAYNRYTRMCYTGL
jgi:hypothetical protein